MIDFNYKQAIKQANELKDIADEVQTLVNSLKSRQAELTYAWKGESAQVFMEKTEELFKDISKTAKTTSGIAGAIKTAANALKAAEDAAKQIAETVGL